MTPSAEGLDDDVTSRLRPELRPFVEFRTDLSSGSLAALRDTLNGRREASAVSLDTSGVEIADGHVPADGGHGIAVRIYRGGSSPAPVVLFCHSGAFVLGDLNTDHRQCVEMARRAECTVVSVDYRLAPEHPYPAGFNDALTVLKWVAAQSDFLGIDASRLAVAGSSAGGAIAALLAQCSSSGGAPPLIFQLLHQPVVDDSATPSKVEFTRTPGFDGPTTRQMWQHLGPQHISAAAVPARSADLASLPSALITCSELDPLRDEAIEYALALMRSGVATELHVFAGTCHGFDSLLPDWDVSQELFALQAAALRRAFGA